MLEFYKYKKLLADRKVLWLIEMMNNKCWLEIDLQIMSPASFGKLLFQEYGLILVIIIYVCTEAL